MAPRLAVIAEENKDTSRGSFFRPFIPQLDTSVIAIETLLATKPYRTYQVHGSSLFSGGDGGTRLPTPRLSLASPTVLAFPDPTASFELHSDASRLTFCHWSAS